MGDKNIVCPVCKLRDHIQYDYGTHSESSVSVHEVENYYCAKCNIDIIVATTTTIDYKERELEPTENA